MTPNNTQFCTHPRHGTPCPLPCLACEEECDIEIVPSLEIDTKGNISTLYNDLVDLYEIGRIHNVQKASFVEFAEEKQEWQIISVKTGEVLGSDKNREKAIEKEIQMFQPGGDYYENNR